MYPQKVQSNFLLAFLSIFSVLLTACGGSKVESPNKAPIIVLNSENSFNEQTHVELNVSDSYDNDGEIVSYLWEQTSGISVSLVDPNKAIATFESPRFNNPTSYTDITLSFLVTVTDNDGVTTKESVTIMVNQLNLHNPTANAGPTQIAQVGDLVKLDGSTSSDVESSSLDYSWIQTDETGFLVTLNDSDTPSPYFTMPDVTINKSLTFQLSVTDLGGKNSTDSVNITLTPNVTAKINDTGITKCGDFAYEGGSLNHNNNLSCKKTIDEDGDIIPAGQDGHYGRDTMFNQEENPKTGFSYTKLDNSGNPLAESATEWSCVEDNVTGLVWEVKTTDGGLRDLNNTYSWFNANPTNNGGNKGSLTGGNCPDLEGCHTEQYVSLLNELQICGISSWRVPEVEEARSIVNYGPDYYIDTRYFPNTQPNKYWTATPYVWSQDDAWLVSFSGGLSHPYLKNFGRPVRLVSTK